MPPGVAVDADPHRRPGGHQRRPDAGLESACGWGSAAAAQYSLALALWLDPDAALVHQAYLALDNLLAILRMLHGRALQVEVLRIDRLLVEELIEFGTQVFHPVVPLGADRKSVV